MDKYLGIIKDALSMGIKSRCHFEDITRADFYGFVVPFANELMKLMKESGIPIKIRMCDTMGYGVTFPACRCLAVFRDSFMVFASILAFPLSFSNGLDITISTRSS